MNPTICFTCHLCVWLLLQLVVNVIQVSETIEKIDVHNLNLLRKGFD